MNEDQQAIEKREYAQRLQAEIGKHATVEPGTYRIPGHTVPWWCKFKPLRREVPEYSARLVLSMRRRA